MLRINLIVENLSKFKARVKIGPAQNPQSRKSMTGATLPPILKNPSGNVNISMPGIL
jgi:hypothetical protein